MTDSIPAPTSMPQGIDTRPVINALLEVFGSTTARNASEREYIVSAFVCRVGAALAKRYNVTGTSLFNRIFSTVFNAMWNAGTAPLLALEDSEAIMLEVFKESASEIPTKLKHPQAHLWHMKPNYEGRKTLLNFLLCIFAGSGAIYIDTGHGLPNLAIILAIGFVSGIGLSWLVDKLANWETEYLFKRHMHYLELRTHEVVEHMRSHGQLENVLGQMPLNATVREFLN